MSRRPWAKLMLAQPENKPSPAAPALQFLSGLKSGLGAGLRRAGFHLAALVVAFAFPGGGVLGALYLYVGLVCLVPRGFTPRRTDHLFPFVVALGQLGLTLLLGYPPPLAVFLAGAQNWLQRAVIRRFHLGFDWAPLPFILGGLVRNAGAHEFSFAFLALAAGCGLGAYYAAQALDRRKRAVLETEAEAREERNSPFRQFYISLDDFENKAGALPEEPRAHVSAIALAGRNILECMNADQKDAQAGSRFLGRYLPAAHTLVDEYTRLGRDGRGHQEIEAVLGRVDKTLDRLALAFQREHASLLSNDAMQLSAEMQVLDKLLKIDGR